MADEDKILQRVLDETTSFLNGLDERPVAARTDVDLVAEALGGPLAEQGNDPLEVVEELIAAGLVATPLVVEGDPKRLLVEEAKR